MLGAMLGTISCASADLPLASGPDELGDAADAAAPIDAGSEVSTGGGGHADATVGLDAPAGDGSPLLDAASEGSEPVRDGSDAAAQGRDVDAGDNASQPPRADAADASPSRDATEASPSRDATPSTADASVLAYAPWPGGTDVSTVDDEGDYAGNLSGLAFDPGTSGAGATLWGVQNDPATLYQLRWNGMTWESLASGGWQAGKKLRYPDGNGEPDAEGVTLAEPESTAVYVVAERDNLNKDVSRLSVLRFDPASSGNLLTASNVWDLTDDLPAVPANVGLEAITWVPDTALVARAFIDDSTGEPYQPTRYAAHGSGLFFVGMEASGMIYAYALSPGAPGFHRIATISSGQPAVMDLSYDREVNQLWTYCDDTCGNRATVLAVSPASVVGSAGHFALRAAYERPRGMANLNNEGIAFASEGSCEEGHKSFFWADDSATGGHSIRRGSVTCGPLP
jgi:hypothetical protein